MPNLPHRPADAAFTLQATWQACVQQYAITFLNQVIGPETPLSDVAMALRFLADQTTLCEGLHLRGIFGAAPTNSAKAKKHRKQRRIALPRAKQLALPNCEAASSASRPSDAAPPPLASSTAPTRSAEDTKHLKGLLIRTLVGSRVPQTTGELFRALHRTGEDVPLPELERLLDALQAEGRIMQHAQKSRAWMFCPQSHMQAWGFTVKKAEAPRTPVVEVPCALAPPSPDEAKAAPETVSAAMQLLGKPATDSERERLKGMLLMAAKLRGLHLQRGNEGDEENTDLPPSVDHRLN